MDSRGGSAAMRECPGCGLGMPAREQVARTYYHCSPECWSVYGEVLAREYQDAVVFSRVHQLTVDAYAAQHAGGPHPDKSVGVHLVGLHLVLDEGFAPRDVPRRLQAMVGAVKTWPHLEPPAGGGPLTVFDVALAGSQREHVDRVRAWAEQVWASWRPHRETVVALARGQWRGPPADRG